MDAVQQYMTNIIQNTIDVQNQAAALAAQPVSQPFTPFKQVTLSGRQLDQLSTIANMALAKPVKSLPRASGGSEGVSMPAGVPSTLFGLPTWQVALGALVVAGGAWMLLKKGR